MFTTRFDSTRRSLFHTRSSSYKVKNISIIVNLPSFKQTQTTRLETEGEGIEGTRHATIWSVDSIDEKEEGKRREEEEEVEGDEVAREADGILDRKDVRFSTCRPVVEACSPQNRSRNRPPPLRNWKSHDSKRHFKEGKHRWRFKDN